MRLIRLRVRNIASLKGEHEINFQEILAGSPLFAITGETGSGKSSVLNSIGLALYGEIYKKNVNQIDVVTLGEKEGQIELVFQVKGDYYLADWRARVLKQNGEPYSTPQSPARNLYKMEGSDFDSPKTIANTTASELLNLDFDQFSRCIILNQGEFAKFLTSTFKERKDILEKLYPGEVLDSLSKELESEKKTLEKAKHDLDIELQAIQGDNISGETLKSEKKKYEKDLKELSETFEHLELLARHFGSLSSYHTGFGENQKRRNSVQEEIALETTKHNHLLKAGEEINERHLKVKALHEANLPRYQIYLKKEEELKHLLLQTSEQQKKIEEAQKDLSFINQKFELNLSREKELLQKAEEDKKALTRSFDELKKHRSHFQNLFEIHSEVEVITEELSGKETHLTHLTESGKELKTQFDQIEKDLTTLPKNIEESLKEVLKEKEELSKITEERNKAEAKSQELLKQKAKVTTEIENLNNLVLELNLAIKSLQDEIGPMEATLKLQEVLAASEICVNHALSENKDSCPVCEQSVPKPLWDNLKEKLAKLDLGSLQLKFTEASGRFEKNKRESDFYNERITKLGLEVKEKDQEIKALEIILEKEILSPQDLDNKFALLQKQVWQKESLTKDLKQKETELNKTRELYAKAKKELDSRKQVLASLTEKLTVLANELKTVIPEVTKDNIRSLREDVKVMTKCLDIETLLEKSIQDKEHLSERKNKTEKEITDIRKDLALGLGKVQDLREELQEALGGAQASVLIQEMNTKLKNSTEEWNTHNSEQSKQEQVLKRSQGRLYELDELIKSIDLQFTQEKIKVKEIAARDFPLLDKDIFSKLKNLDLTLSSTHELFVPLEEMLLSLKGEFKEKKEASLSLFASVSTRLADWEKLQDKIALLELKAKDINETLSRKQRLFEVLGKDELRTFVLSLVEENLIHQTNLELQKLCQGRYEIIHQVKSMKMTPEFYILDKFREGGQRKVSTLSGGETFMVSLAMALGLAEMTRGQAEIESLFIDEGFGTLDSDSLEDVLDMLQQIQNRGLMVGLISHIKTLTEALPVNLLLTKKQDGTSSVSVKFN